MTYHILDKITCKIPVINGKPYKPVKTLLLNIAVEKLYSYVVYNILHDEYIVDISYSQIDEYNTILKEEAICEIQNILVTNNSTKRVIGFRQPPLELYIQLAEPMVEKLSQQMHNTWHIELDDLRQTCYECICRLYNKGYYINPALVYRVFTNDILKSIKKDKNAPELISIEKAITEDESFNIGDMLADETAEDDIYSTITKENEEFVLLNMRNLIIDLVGKRQYDQFVREYGNKYTTATTRTKITKLKRKLQELGVNYTWFDGTTINLKRSK